MIHQVKEPQEPQEPIEKSHYMDLEAKSPQQWLRYVNACGHARRWVASLPPGTTVKQVWQQCQRGDWMLWMLGELEELFTTQAPFWPRREKLVGVACQAVKDLCPEALKDSVLEEAFTAAQRWANGFGSLQRLGEAIGSLTGRDPSFLDSCVRGLCKAARAKAKHRGYFSLCLSTSLVMAVGAASGLDYNELVPEEAIEKHTVRAADIVREAFPSPDL